MASEKKKPCVVLFPCAGMCHLVLFSRFAANLTKHGIANIVLVTARTTVSDQMFNAVAAEKGGLCVWHRRFSGVDSFLKGEEIGSLLKLWTCNRDHKERAERVREEALRAVEEGGDSHKMILELKRRLESAT